MQIKVVLVIETGSYEGLQQSTLFINMEETTKTHHEIWNPSKDASDAWAVWYIFSTGLIWPQKTLANLLVSHVVYFCDNPTTDSWLACLSVVAKISLCK